MNRATWQPPLLAGPPPPVRPLGDVVKAALSASFGRNGECLYEGAGEVAAVVAQVVEATGVSEEAIRGRGRQKRTVRARHAVWLALRALGWSLPEVGREFSVDHTTVLAAVRKASSASEITAEASEVLRQNATEAHAT